MAIKEHAFGKRVHSRFGGDRLVTLGVDDTCGGSQFRGLGTECQKLVLKKDRFYHCKMCGLVFKKPEQIIFPSGPLDPVYKPCMCRQLVNVQKMSFSCYAGCTIPINEYHCYKCRRKFHSPYYCREASLGFQESAAAKAHVKEVLRNKKTVSKNKSDKVLKHILELKKMLSGLSPKERRKILDQLGTMIS